MEKMQVYGYARVSSRDQNEIRQVIALKEFGVPESSIIVEKASGKDFNRDAYQRLMETLRPGDTLVIKSLDRLGRDYNAVVDEWRHLTKERGVAVAVIDMPLLDTRQKDRDLTTAFVAELVLQILSYVAELERAFNRQRQAEGIAAAKAKGIKLGRPPQERPEELLCRVHKLWQGGEISAREAAKQLGISHTTFLRWVNDTQM
jgi:DNA invertase Pin-like site-specific DNA recombinase